MSEMSVTIDGTIAIVTLDNPPQNRLSPVSVKDFEAIIETVTNSEARAVLVRANGDNFSFGGDIRPWPSMTTDGLRALFESYLTVFNRFERLPIPTVAAVQGICYGGGFELALRCDLIIASASATFTHPEQTLAITTLLGGVQRVAERAGRAFAAELAYTSRPTPADVMFHRGVINRVVPDSDLESEALTLVKDLARGPTRAHAAHKALLRQWASGGVPAADDALYDISMPLFDTDDTKRGLESAINAMARGEKRPVLDFKGR